MDPALATAGTSKRRRIILDDFRERSDYGRSKVPSARVLEVARQKFAGRRWVYVTHNELPAEEESHDRLLFATKDRVWKAWLERYFVYEPVSSHSVEGARDINVRIARPASAPITLHPR